MRRWEREGWERNAARQRWIDGRFAWCRRRWGLDFASHVGYHFDEWGHLEAAEIWAGICWGLITEDGPQDLDEAAELEDLQVERNESIAQSALAHGF